MIESQKPDVVISNLWGEPLAEFIRQIKPTGLLKTTMLTSLFDMDVLRSMGKEMPEGLLGYSRCPPYGFIDRTKRFDKFRDKFYERYQQWPSEYALMAYDGLVVLTEAINKAESTDSDRVVKALEGLSFRSLRRGYRFIRPEDHMADVSVYVGKTGADPKFKDMLILTQLTEVPAEMVWKPVEEVKRLQPKP